MSILTATIMQTYKKCSINNAQKLSQLIEEVEYLELSKLLGIDVYKQLVTDCNTTPREQEVTNILNNGLYKAISYFVYAQYILNSAITDTFTGMVQKTRQDSENVPIGTLKNEQTRYREIALLSFNEVKGAIESRYNKTTPNKTKTRVKITNINGGNLDSFDKLYFEV